MTKEQLQAKGKAYQDLIKALVIKDDIESKLNDIKELEEME